MKNRLLQELIKYNPYPEHRIRRIYNKCLKNHPRWAEQIKEKYGNLLLPQNNKSPDIILAFGMMLQAQKQQNEK